MATIFRIQGIVREKESRCGIGKLLVKAYDRDLLYDDLLGSAITRTDGSFEIISEAEDFRDFFDRQPDIYLKIYVTGSGGSAPRDIYSTENAVRWNAGQTELFEVEIPAERLGDLTHCEDEHPDGCSHEDHHHRHCTPVTKCRDIYLKIEKLPAYSPVAPDDAEHHRYRVDCMRNMGHEDATIPNAEVEQRRIDALVYREYLDPDYTIANTAKVIAADINEPRYDRRIPGAVIYATPGERLFVHVLNADDVPHSFHVHGLIYGIDSDGSWPLGVHSHNGRRSDAICPGEKWCYVFDVTEETVGAWPFHDHVMNIQEQADRGLFGGIIVRDVRCPKPDYEVPLFFHRLAGARRTAHFDSGPLNRTSPPFSFTIAAEGTFDYFCLFHPMSGVVRVTMGGAASAAVSILDSPSRFEPADVTIRPGGTVTWTHNGNQPHTVTDRGGAGLDSYALNGRSFVGNAPTIVAETGKRIRWYIFNLDLSTNWHNFHAHSQRWMFSHEIVDTRSLGPAESFVADTLVPPVILLPLKGDCREHHKHRCDPHEGHSHHSGGHSGGHSGEHSHSEHEHDLSQHPSQDHSHDEHQYDDSAHPPHDHPQECRRVKLQGDFLIHCHAEMHMMTGMAAVVRAIQEVEVTPELEHALGFDLPLAHDHACAEADHHLCAGDDQGSWEQLPDAPIFVVHAAVLHTGKVLLFSGRAEVNNPAMYPLESRLWVPATGTMTTQAFGEDLFCSGHAFLPDGRLCVMGGVGANMLYGSARSTHLFNPATETWLKVADMSAARWYPTALTMPDGRIMAVSGRNGGGPTPVEIYDAATNAWQTVTGAGRTFTELYPSLHLLPSGQIFYARGGWTAASGTQTAYLTMTGANSGLWTNFGQEQFYDRQEGTGVMQIDTTVSPPSAQVYIIGGGVSGAATTRNPLSAEKIDLTTLAPAPAWQRCADMNFARTNVNAVLLPDGSIFVVGGQRNGKWNSDPQHVMQPEIYDPRTNTWTSAAAMAHPRQYHSIAVLLPDGRVLSAGGVDPTPGAPQRDQRFMEVFSPGYLSRGPRPVITSAPASASYGANLDITTPDAPQIDSVVFLRPGSATHHTDAGQRYIRLPIVSRDPGQLRVQAPANGNIAPPGYYMLFIVKANGVPSLASFIRLT